MKKSVGILISGRGSNMLALAEAAQAPDYPAEITTVLSDQHNAEGLGRARELGLQAQAIPRSDFENRKAFEAAINAQLEKANVDLICLAGFMRILSTSFVEKWTDRLINIHPSLLPAFKGLDTHQRAIDAGVKMSGCTVHFVRPEMDEGPIIGQTAVPVLPNDTAESLADRILIAEHRLYPFALKQVASGKVKIQGNTCQLTDVPWAVKTFSNPLPV